MKRRAWSNQLVTLEIRRVMGSLNLKRMPSNTECVFVTGDTALSNRITRDGGFYYWADRLGLKLKKSETSFSLKYEVLVKEYLENLGYDTELMSVRHPYDLLVSGGVKIDVKVSRPYDGGSGRFHSFNLESKYHSCDIFILVCLDEAESLEKLLIIPSKDLEINQLSLGKVSKYDKYRDKWSYIGLYNKFFQSI